MIRVFDGLCLLGALVIGGMAYDLMRREIAGATILWGLALVLVGYWLMIRTGLERFWP